MGRREDKQSAGGSQGQGGVDAAKETSEVCRGGGAKMRPLKCRQ